MNKKVKKMTKHEQDLPETEESELTPEMAETAMAAEMEPQGPSPEAVKIQELTAQLSTLEDKYKRTLAEYDNFRKRSQKERESLFLDVTAGTVALFLPVLDNLERAAAQAPDDKGAQLICKQFKDILDKLNVKPFGDRGDAFDPKLHNAVAHQDDESLGENTVCEVMLNGYQMGDRVIRFAMVQVAN